MNGPDHFREAERLLANAQRELEAATPNTISEVLETTTVAVAKAQAHATLAKAAAIIDTSRSMRDEDVAIAWGGALS